MNRKKANNVAENLLEFIFIITVYIIKQWREKDEDMNLM